MTSDRPESGFELRASGTNTDGEGPSGLFHSTEDSRSAAGALQAKSILIRRKTLDPWFISRAGMNLYRGCSHDCAYCDGRSENYRVEGDFARDVVYKHNAVDILTRELDPRRRRKEFRPGFVFIGGGVSDSWQKAEARTGLTRRVLELFRVFPQPLLLLTKSALILRDLKLLVELNRQARVVIGVSISSMHEKVSAVMEGGASLPKERLDVIRQARNSGLAAGVMLMPIIPLISDRPALLDESYAAAKEAGAQFVMAGPMTLKAGRQQNHFMAVLEKYFPDIAASYGPVYSTMDRWGNPSPEYLEYWGNVVHRTALRYGMPRRIPSHLFPDNLSTAEKVSVMLGQMDGLLRERGLSSSFGRASRSLAALSLPLEDPAAWKSLRSLSGVGPSGERVIKQILDTGTSPAYERLLVGRNLSG